MDKQLWTGVLVGVVATFVVLGGLVTAGATAMGMGEAGMMMDGMMDECRQMMANHDHGGGEGHGHDHGNGTDASGDDGSPAKAHVPRTMGAHAPIQGAQPASPSAR